MPTDDIAGMSDVEICVRAGASMGWYYDPERRAYRNLAGARVISFENWNPHCDHNDAHRLVEECGRRGLARQFGRALRKLLPGRAVVMHGGNYLADMLDLAAADGASATPRQITEAAVRVLEDSPASTRN